MEDALRALIYHLEKYDVRPEDIKLVGKDRHSDFKLQCAIKASLGHHAVIYTEQKSETSYCGLQIGEYRVQPLSKSNDEMTK